MQKCVFYLLSLLATVCQSAPYQEQATSLAAGLKQFAEYIRQTGETHKEDVNKLLMQAVKHNQLDAVNRHIQDGADLDYRDENRNTPLHIAAANGHTTMVKHLLAKGATTTFAYNEDKNTPITLTIDKTHQDTREAFISHIFKKIVDEAKNGKSDTFSRALDHDEVPAQRDFPSKLLEENQQNYTLLHFAAHYGFEEIGERLINATNHEADVNAQQPPEDDDDFPDGPTPLHVAVEQGQTEFAKLLLQHGAHITAQNEMGDTALHITAKEGNDTIAQELLKNAPAKDISQALQARNMSSRMPLHTAVKNGHYDLAHLFLQNGAENSLQMKDGSFHTPLHTAAQEGDVNLLELLIQHNAPVNAQGQNGTPLHLAVNNNKVECVKKLVAKEADPTERKWDENDPTPLHIAAKNCFKDLIPILLDAADQRGKKAKLLATQAQLAEEGELLKPYEWAQKSKCSDDVKKLLHIS